MVSNPQNQNEKIMSSANDKLQYYNHPSFINDLNIKVGNKGNVLDDHFVSQNIKNKMKEENSASKRGSIVKNMPNSPLRPYISQSSLSLRSEIGIFRAFFARIFGLRIKKGNKIKVNVGSNVLQEPEIKKNTNKISTTKYNFLTWFPKSLIMQFYKVANIYFLLITILTAMPFSPKMPQTMFLTFSSVLLFTMFKEGYEDYQRYKLDKEINGKNCEVFDYSEQRFVTKTWADIQIGNLIRVKVNESFPADILLTKSSSKNGICYVDTMNLDGETNLKEKIVLKELNDLEELIIYNLKGVLECDAPNAYLERFEAVISSSEIKNSKITMLGIQQLLLRGSVLKNTDWIIGFVIYTGHETKIFQNSRKPPVKMSNVLRIMNKILYSVFIFQISICIILASISVKWQSDNAVIHFYIGLEDNIDLRVFLERIFIFLVAFSQLIPISLYVALEILKLIQAYLISNDNNIYYEELNKKTIVRSSELIEELGQIEFIFSDKTGTLTCNCMEFKKCSINGEIYGELPTNENVLNQKKININLNIKKENKTPKSCKIRQTKKSIGFEFEAHPLILKENHHINQDPRAYEILSNPKNPQALYIDKFFRFIALCHTVFSDRNSGELKYQASSPDELALINGAANMGYKFLDKFSDYITIQIKDSSPEKWFTILEFPFDSTRKRMSLIVKNETESNYLLLTKGADSVMMSRIREDQISKFKIEADLKKFAVEGLRTLVMGQKYLTKKEFDAIFEEYSNIKISKDRAKEKKLNKLFDTIEKNLELIGVSAIEDKLQEGVPETISKLIEAKIRIWVLTGDKQETAIEIGKSCKLIQSHMELIILSSNSLDEFDHKLSKLIQEYGIEPKRNSTKKKEKAMSIVIDGNTLNYIFNSPEKTTEILFFNLCLLADSCICCRVSPKQKADVVKLAKKNGKWLTLAIGDGANDVSMIMEAHIGVGVFGKEGTQAARSADIAIGQFKYLQRLLFLHGRWGYRRVSGFICYYFYKNCVMVFPEIFFAFFNGFSGQIFFLDWFPMLFNAFWTSWPCLINYSLDQDVNMEWSVNEAHLYQLGPKKAYFNIKIFWIWFINSIMHGSYCFWLPILSMDCSYGDSGFMPPHWMVSTVSFCIVMHVITVKLFLESNFWTKINITFGIFSIIFYYLCLLILNSNQFAKLLQPQFNSMMSEILGISKVWLLIIFVPAFALFPDLILLYWKKAIKMDSVQKVLIKQRKSTGIDY